VPFCILINSEYKFLFLYILTRVFVLLWRFGISAL
jgi:hypothetical protein